jgi:thiol-disulfide isomerase/thioredoxin
LKGENARTPRRLGFITWALMGLGLAGIVALGIEEEASSRKVGAGMPAPQFDLEKYGGGRISLADQRGKVVMLDFWATWCGPCKEEMPALVRLAKEFEPRGLVFVAANHGDDPSTRKGAVGVFIAQTEAALGDYVAFATEEITRQYSVEALPTLYFIDREGRIVESHRGTLSESQLRRRIARVLQ